MILRLHSRRETGRIFGNGRVGNRREIWGSEAMLSQLAIKFLEKIKSRVFYKKKTLILRIEIRTRTDGPMGYNREQ